MWFWIVNVWRSENIVNFAPRLATKNVSESLWRIFLCRSRWPWKKCVGTTPVGGVVWAAISDRAFEKSYTRNLHQQHAHQERTRNRPSCSSRGSNQKEAPPNTEVAEIIWVACVLPKSLIHDFGGIVGIPLEGGQLPVADRLKKQADRKNSDSSEIQQAQWRRRRGGSCLEWKRNEPQDHALQQENGQETDPPESFAICGSHSRVARVLAMSKTA